MEFAFTDDQLAIRETAETYLADAAGLDRLRAVIHSGTGFDADLWNGLAGEMSFAGLMVPEAHGGAGLSAVEMALVLEQTGARLAVIPFFETAVLAVQAVLAAGSAEQHAALLPGLADGTQKAAFAFAPLTGWAGAGTLGPRLNRGATGWLLQGQAGFVSFAHVADLLIIAAQTDAKTTQNGISLLALPAATPGITIERQNPLDITRPYANLRFENVTVPDDAILGMPGGADAAYRQVLACACGLLAAEQTGGAAFCLNSTLDYAKQRVQFGRLIGSFQAVKHELATMMLQLEAARSAAYYAATAIAEASPELEEAVHIARAWCSEAYKYCASEAIQLHGGIGFTWEHQAHLYFKRARATASWFGDAAEHREAIAGLIFQENA
jgi:alkylation response protein AidB-like acyl-CoA dehydrogenase